MTEGTRKLIADMIADQNRDALGDAMLLTLLKMAKAEEDEEAEAGSMGDRSAQAEELPGQLSFDNL